VKEEPGKVLTYMDYIQVAVEEEWKRKGTGNIIIQVRR
jgi:hypothetical protein